MTTVRSCDPAWLFLMQSSYLYYVAFVSFFFFSINILLFFSLLNKSSDQKTHIFQETIFWIKKNLL